MHRPPKAFSIHCCGASKLKEQYCNKLAVKSEFPERLSESVSFRLSLRALDHENMIVDHFYGLRTSESR